MNTFKTICFRCILTIGAMMLFIAPASAQNILELVSQAEQGDAQAQYQLGRYYYSGQGVTQSYDRAVAWWQKAAMQGVADAQCNLGVCYKFGRGVAQDYVEAAKWYRMAAEQGNAEGQYNLGLCYYAGNGVEQSNVEAAK